MMRRAYLAIELILLAWLLGADTFAQQGDPAASPVLARAQQLITLVSSKDVDAPERLKRALLDENWYVRGEAARAIARLGDKSAGPLLLPLLRDQSWFVRCAALEAIASLGTGSDASAVREVMNSTDAYVRARSAATLPWMDPAAAETLIQALGDGEQLVRRAAARSLGELKSANAVDPLIALLKDDDPNVRKTAAVALGRIGDRKAVDAIRAAASKAPGDQWEYSAALYRLGSRESLDRITPALRNEYADVRQGALKALLEFADARSLPALVSVAGGESSSSKKEALSIRLALADGLASFEGEDARVVLVNMLDDPEAAVRAASVASLAKISRSPKNDSSERSLIALVSALKRENAPVVIDAITEALSAFDRPRAADLLLDARTADGKLSPNVRKALAASGVTAENESAQLTAGDVTGRVRAADRLARLGDAKAVEPLIEALTAAKEIQVKVKAAEALGVLRDRRAVDSLVVTRSRN
jgi:HEAT repeat protein